MNFKDYYKILEITQSATQEDIKKSYRRLAFKYHPDKTSGDRSAELKFKEILEAYTTLHNTIQRESYDYRYKEFYSNPKPSVKVAVAEAKKLAPNDYLKTFKEINKSIDSITNKGRRVNKIAVYDRMYGLLSKPNIDYLLQHGDIKVNNQIIDEALKLCNLLSFEEVENINYKLARLAGTDNAKIEKIHALSKKKKYKNYIFKYQEQAIYIGLLLLFILLFYLLND